MSEKNIRFINLPDDLKIDANTHSFSPSLAKAVGLVEAILLQHFFYWHNCNDGNKDMTKDGRVWFFRSVKQIADNYEYLSVNKVRDAIERLVYSGLVIKGDFNEDKLQRVSWYSLSDKVLEIFGKSQTICENHKPFVKITNINYNKETIIRNKEKEKEEYNSSKKKNEENPNEVEKTWRNDFDTYRQIVEEAKAKLKADSYFREKMEEIHINIDYDRTLENSVVVFWGTEEGWKKKCGTRGNNIDMVSTLKKCFDKNIVYKPRTYNATKNSTYSIASEQRVIRQETDKRNIREDGTRFENGYIVYRSTKGLDEYIDGKPEDIPMRPDDRHDWYSVYKVWAIFNEDGTFTVKGKRYYVSSKDYRPHEIPVNAPYRESEYTEYNPTTNSWEL